MKHCCRVCCCAIFCCTCCRKTPLNVINEETKLLPKNDATRNEIELEELYVFGSAPEELRKNLLEAYGRKPVKKIVLGKSHCLILLNNNTLIGFGSNEEGQLGLPLKDKICNKITRIPITCQNIGDIQNLEIIDIAAGEDFSLVLLKNAEDQTILIKFGIDVINRYVEIPNTEVQKIEKLPDGVENIKNIFAFEKRIMFYTRDNKIYVGGKDFMGTEIDYYKNLEFEGNIENLYMLKESCIVTDSNDVMYGLGDNSYKELGIGSNYNINKFHKLLFKFPKSHIKKISAGARHILFLLENGELFCVGDNSEGQCCGATSNCVVPMKLELNNKEKIIDCFAGYNHNLIILQNGSVYTWGNTTNGKLGYYEDKFTQEVPREILGLKIKCINNVCLGYQMTVIATGQEQDSLVIKNRPPRFEQGMNEMN